MKYKVAVVTPYYKESTAVLEQCHNSVLDQTYECDHIVVSDGHKNDVFENAIRTLHVTLPKAHGDNGCTPRGIGSILAENYGYDAVAYLDADNWFYPEHIENMVAAHAASRRPIVCCKRTFHDLDGNLMPITEHEENINKHFDTSCFVVFKPAFSIFRSWFMPKELGPICDRIFFQKIIHDRFQIHVLNDRTVAFRTQYAIHYRAAKLPVPVNAKETDDPKNGLKYLHNINNVNFIVNKLGFYPKVSG